MFRLNQLVSWIGPTTIIGVGGMAALVALALFSPLFQLTRFLL